MAPMIWGIGRNSTKQQSQGLAKENRLKPKITSMLQYFWVMMSGVWSCLLYVKTDKTLTDSQELLLAQASIAVVTATTPGFLQHQQGYDSGTFVWTCLFLQALIIFLDAKAIANFQSLAAWPRIQCCYNLCLANKLHLWHYLKSCTEMDNKWQKVDRINTINLWGGWTKASTRLFCQARKKNDI